MVHRKRVKQAGGPATYSTAAAKVVKGELPIGLSKVTGQANAPCSAIDNVNAHSIAVLLFPGSTLSWIVWFALLVFAVELAQQVGILVAPPFVGSVSAILAFPLALGFALLARVHESISLRFTGVKILSRCRLPLLALAASLRVGYASVYGRLAFLSPVRHLFRSISYYLGNGHLFTRFDLAWARWLGRFALSASVMKAGRRRGSSPEVVFVSLKSLLASSALLELDRRRLNASRLFSLLYRIMDLRASHALQK